MQVKFDSILAMLALVFVSQFTLADDYADTKKVFENAGESGTFFEKSYAYALFPNIGKGGIVRDPALYAGVERKFFDLAQNFRLTVKAWLNSPITGGDGNREFFIWLKK